MHATTHSGGQDGMGLQGYRYDMTICTSCREREKFYIHVPSPAGLIVYPWLGTSDHMDAVIKSEIENMQSLSQDDANQDLSCTCRAVRRSR